MTSPDPSNALAPDFELLFQSTPVPYLVLRPDLIIVAVNDAYLLATQTRREHLLGQYMFDAFPDNPADPEATGVRNLHASLKSVLENHATHVMAIQKYDIPLRDSLFGEFEERYWSPSNSPVFNRAGELTYIIHKVEDVTEQVRKQQAAEAGEARFRQIADAMPQIVWSTLPDGYHDYFNHQWFDYVGMPEGSTDGDKWSALFHPDDMPQTWERWHHSLRTGEPYEVEYRVRHKSGQWRWLLGRALPIRNDAGEIIRWMGTCTDIHDWKLTQAKLQDAQFRLEGALTAAEIGTWNWNLKKNRIYADPNLARLFGLSQEDAHGGPVENYLAAIHPDDVAPVRAAIANSIEHGAAYQQYYRVIQKDGSVRHIHSRGKIRFDENGQAAWMPGVAIDVTEQKLAEEARLETESKFRTLAENIPQLAWMAHTDGSIFWFNNRWFEYTGTTLGQMRDWGWQAVHHPDYVDSVKAKYRELIVNRQVIWEDTFPLRGADGLYRWFLSRAVPVRSVEGEIVYWLGTNTDITVQREAEHALERANRRKDDFLAMLAHELRNPLAPISTAAQLLKLPGQNEALIKRSSDIIARQVNHLTELVDDLLDVSRVTRGLVSIDREEVDLKSVVSSAVEQAMPLIESRQHRLTVRQAAGHPLMLGDRTRLIQVLTNLLNNSAKYTPQGGQIMLSMEVDGSRVVIEVSDNGVGMDATLVPAVFDLFTQAERTPDRSQGGLGLGLALVKSIVSLHHGEVVAKSDGPGKGSTFTVTLPLLDRQAMATDRTAAGQAGPGGHAPLDILLVDDNTDAAQSLSELLQSQGHRVTVKSDAHGALEYAESSHPDVFLLDIGLPDMDGYELSRRLHARGANENATYIAVTGYGQAHDKVLAKAAGFDHYFVKPVELPELQKVLVTQGPH